MLFVLMMIRRICSNVNRSQAVPIHGQTLCTLSAMSMRYYFDACMCKCNMRAHLLSKPACTAITLITVTSLNCVQLTYARIFDFNVLHQFTLGFLQFAQAVVDYAIRSAKNFLLGSIATCSTLLSFTEAHYTLEARSALGITYVASGS